MDFFHTIQSFFYNDGPGVLQFLRILSGMMSTVFFAGIVYSVYQFVQVTEEREERREAHFKRERGETSQKLSPRQERWLGIVELFKSKDQNAWRVAIIDADSMLEDLVTERGHHGDSFGEKLKSLQQEGIPWTDAAWDVHLLRNKLAHEGSRYPLNEREAYRAYKIYENIFEGTGYLA